ncbi:MAG: ABC transporter ATP-binding protein [Deferribacteres bacterium]|nr:ABC transporter ATP-binding protein [Deferribacteres bacterium]
MYDLRVSGLCVERGGFRLGLSRLFIGYGEKVAVMGENGSGKSTLLLSLCGMLSFRGEVLYGDKPVSALSFRERARIFSYLPQNPEILFPYTVEEIVSLGFDRSDKDFLKEVFSLFELEAMKKARITELSGGEKKRVFIARAVAQSAPILFLDEPTSSLDVRHRVRFLEYLKELKKTVCCVMHDVNEALRYFDRFLFLKKGELVYDLKKEEVNEEVLSDVFDVAVSSCQCFVFSCSR